ncbi:glycosyltransferase [Bacillus sp. JJ1521]|uniref:glycosyltransferase family 32 protein n=1 Tax=Bacillus sp. JJ1521 TaxID=3122957 RepID=UPI002FFFE63F
MHYCWFGDKKKSELAKKCIKTWKEKLPDYEFMEWNETNCNMEINTYVKQAYEAGKWAFVSDYFRLKYLYEYGGIYMDTDVEITKNIDSFRINNSFLSFESANFIQTGIIGSVKGAPLIKKLLEYYQNESFITETGEYNAKPNVPRTTSLLVNEYGLQLNGKRQALKDGIVIYPVNELTLDVGDGQNYTVHHFDCSWWDVKTGPTWKEVLLKKYFEEQEQFNK